MSESHTMKILKTWKRYSERKVQAISLHMKKPIRAHKAYKKLFMNMEKNA